MSYNDNYLEKIQEDVINARWFARLDFAADFSDPVYFTSHADMTSIFTTEDVVASTLISAPVSSQELKPISSIGTFSHLFNDAAGVVHDKLRAKLVASQGVNLKRMQIFEGFEGDLLADYEITGTGVTGKVSYKNGVYRISGRDVQVFAKDADIFVPVESILLDDIIADKVSTDISFASGDKSINSTKIDLSGFKIGAKIRIANSSANTGFKTVATISASKITVTESITTEAIGPEILVSQATIEVLDESNFQMVKHGASYSDAPNVEVGYIIIGKNKIRYESNPTGLFQNCTQGVLGSKQAESIVDSSVSDESKTKIKSHVYYELPFVELLYGILLSPIYSESGKFLPDNDTLTIDAEYIRATDFTLIGPDLWDTTDASIAKICYFDGLEKTNAKSFIEREILPALTCWMPVYPNGEWGLQRNIAVTENSSPEIVLDDSNIVSYGWLDYDAEDTRNEIVVNWHYSDLDKAFKRKSTFLISDSITVNGASKPHEVSLKGIYNNRHTEMVVAAIAERIAAKVAYPPLRISASISPRIASQCEVGQVVLFKPSTVKDFSGTSATINKAMKIVYMSKELKKGKYNVKLEGSSGKPGPIIHTTQSTVLDASVYTGFATTNVDITTLPSYYTVGSVGHIGNDTFTGGTTLGAKSYYHVGDLVFDAGTTQTCNDNVLLMVDGFFTANSDTIDCKGNGIAGSTGALYVRDGVYSGVGDNSTGIGTTTSGGGFFDRSYYQGYLSASSFSGITVRSKLFPSGMPEINLEYKGTSLYGLSGLDLRGIPGASGGPITGVGSPNYSTLGGAGGAGGGSFVVVSKGSSAGGSADIDTSGADGSDGIDEGANPTLRSGAGGGGHPGAILFINDGVGASPAVLTGKVTQNIGNTQTSGNPLTAWKVTHQNANANTYPDTVKSYYTWHENMALRDVSDEFSLIKYIREAGTAGEEPNLSLPSPISSLVLTSDNSTSPVNNDGTVNVYIKATWAASTDPLVDRNELQYRIYLPDEPWRTYAGLLNRSDNTAWIPNLIVGYQYQVRVRTVNVSGEAGDWVYGYDTAGGKDDAPADPTAFTVTGKIGGIELYISAAQMATDNDLHAVKLYSGTVNNVASADKVQSIGATPSKELRFRYDVDPGETRYHWISYFDRTVNESGTFPADTSGQAQTANYASGTDVQYSDSTPLDDLQPGESGGYNRGVFNETFEIGNIDKWTNYTGSGTYTFPSNGVNGGKVANIDSYSWKYLNKNIPFDPTVLYRMRVRVRMTTAPADPAKDLFYCGVEGYSADGSTLLSISGADTHTSQHYVCASTKDMGGFTLNTWQEFTGYFMGHGAFVANAIDPSSPSGLYAGTVYFRPLFIVNNSDGDGIMEVDYISIDVMPEDADQIPESSTQKWAGESGADVTQTAVETGIDAYDTDVLIRGIDAFSNQAVYYTTNFDSLDAYDDTTSSGGTTLVSAGGGYLSVTTNITSTARAICSRYLAYPVNSMLWSKDRAFKVRVQLGALYTGSTREVKIGIGNENDGIGFSVNSSGNFTGYSVKGAVITTIDLGVATASFTEYDLKCEIIGGATVKFYIAGVYKTGKDITTNIPTSTVTAKYALLILIDNLSTAQSATYEVRTSHWKFSQKD